jgi:uncharacterized integral membrane protein (TIGR00697 family)
MSSHFKFFLLLMSLHGSLLVTSTVAGSKVFALPYGLSASATVLSYMATFIMLDTIAEIYGRSYSRLVINLGLLGMAVSALYFEFTIRLPPAEFWPHQAAFETVLNSSWRIWLAGWSAYLLSQNLDLWSFLKFKEVAVLNKSLVLRAWLSMLIAQLFDTLVFITIAFYGVFPLSSAILGQYFVKVIFATFAAPFVSLAVVLGRRWIKAHSAAAAGDAQRA